MHVDDWCVSDAYYYSNLRCAQASSLFPQNNWDMNSVRALKDWLIESTIGGFGHREVETEFYHI